MDDPRLFGTGGTVNEEILDRAIRRAIRVQQFSKGQAEEIRVLLQKKVYPRLIERVAARLANISARGYDVGPKTSKRTANMFAQVDEIIQEEIQLVAKDAHRTTVAFARSESDWLLRSMSGAAPIELGLSPPSAQVLKSAATSRPFQGRLLRDWYGDLATDTQKRVRGAIRDGMSNGETLDDIVRRLRGTRAGGFRDGVLRTTTRQAQNIARTSMSHVSAHAREATYDANESLIKGVVWVSTLDGRTSLTCIALDGEEFPVGEGERPPAHWGCRSSTIPVLKSWKELGVNAGEMSPGQRASMNGLVPGGTTYGEWLKTQDLAFQNEVLGPGRAKLFREGLGVDAFTGANLKPISLAQLSAAS